MAAPVDRHGIAPVLATGESFTSRLTTALTPPPPAIRAPVNRDSSFDDVHGGCRTMGIRCLQGVRHVHAFQNERRPRRETNCRSRDYRAGRHRAENVASGGTRRAIVSGRQTGIATDGQREGRSLHRSCHRRDRSSHACQRQLRHDAHAFVVEAGWITLSKRGCFREPHALCGCRHFEQRCRPGSAQGEGQCEATIAVTEQRESFVQSNA